MPLSNSSHSQIEAAQIVSDRANMVICVHVQCSLRIHAVHSQLTRNQTTSYLEWPSTV